MALFILTLTHNGKELLNNLYPTLKAAVAKLPIEAYWMIRDNNSTDGTQELIDSWNDPFVNYYKIDHNNDNFSKGNNFLVKKIEEDFVLDINNDYILFCNNDITIQDSNSIKYMLEIIEKDPSVGAVGARLLYPEVKGKKRIVQHAGVILSYRTGQLPYHYRYNEPVDSEMNKNRIFQAVTGAFFLTKASVYKTANGLDERFQWCFDDINFCLKVTYDQRKKVVYCGKTDITHHESITLKKNKINIKYMKHNVMLFQKLWGKLAQIDHFFYLEDPNYKLYNV